MVPRTRTLIREINSTTRTDYICAHKSSSINPHLKAAFLRTSPTSHWKGKPRYMILATAAPTSLVRHLDIPATTNEREEGLFISTSFTILRHHDQHQRQLVVKGVEIREKLRMQPLPPAPGMRERMSLWILFLRDCVQQEKETMVFSGIFIQVDERRSWFRRGKKLSCGESFRAENIQFVTYNYWIKLDLIFFSNYIRKLI